MLDEDHYGLEKVKERIVEYLAVQQRVDKVKAPILCLVGPPGVGKTSLGQSIARATNRKFVRMALGGVRDEAEIRGHRRTYIGSMPGKILQNMSKVGVRNPLFLLDEVDKMGMDFRGDPSSALLEVLDPEQNHTFVDHYVEVEYDLSDVMFVATANTLNIPPPLLDRMEVIRLSGYTEDEKVNIAHALPAAQADEEQRAQARTEVSIVRTAMRDIIRYYTREAGVRSLEREMSKICRKVVKTLLAQDRRRQGDRVDAEEPGQIPGCAPVQLRHCGKAKPGWAGDGSGLDRGRRRIADHRGRGDAGQGQDHHHRQAGRGDAGVDRGGAYGGAQPRAPSWASRTSSSRRAICTSTCPRAPRPRTVPVPASASDHGDGIDRSPAFRCVADVAMTGEITLRGEVLPIGGLKEKLLAAQRGGIKTVLIPEENIKDLAEIPDNVKNRLEIMPVKWIDQVLELALERRPEPLIKKDDAAPITPAAEGQPVSGVITH